MPFGKLGLVFILCFIFFASYFSWIFLSLPQIVTMGDYKPPLLTEVFDRNQVKIGEFFKERRLLFKYEDMPVHLINAFVAAEDGSFFRHKGINYKAIARAFIANLKAGKKVQGGSTITQQMARTLVLSSEKTYTRKLKEVILSLRMEKHLSKQDILYIYLNQIYLGHGAYGVEMASRIYFRKSTKQLSLAEASILAGLPKAPSRFSPIYNPERAKARQVYVLNRMLDEKYITEEEFKKTLVEPVKIYTRKDFSNQGPYYLETVRRVLLKHFTQTDLLEKGLKISTAMDLEKQILAREALQKGLENLDKRQGFRGVSSHLNSEEEKYEFRDKITQKLKQSLKTHLTLPSYEGSMGKKEEEVEEIKNTLVTENERKKQKDVFPWQDYIKQLQGMIFKTYITKVDPTEMYVFTPLGEKLLLIKDLAWLAPPDTKKDNIALDDLTTIFKVNDVIKVRVRKEEEQDKEDQDKENEEPEFIVDLYQEPLVEGAVLSLDLESSDILALVGGYDYKRSQFNRAYQASRQSGSIFKPFIYGAALERGFHPASVIEDAPVVFSSEEADEDKQDQNKSDLPKDDLKEQEEQEEQERWKPANISDRFSGDLLFRTALIRSLNVPTVKIIEKIGIKWARFYARRLGIFSPLNPDFTMALGSSSLTLYELTRAFSVFPRQGRSITPILIHKVEDQQGEELFSQMSLDEAFQESLLANENALQEEKEKWFSEKNQTPRALEWKEILAPDSLQLIPKTNSYIVTSLLSSVVEDSEGTARRAQALKRPLAGKTGTSDGYYDAWFMGFSPFISTGVWVGFDQEKTLGRGETGSRAALPVWMEYMKKTHEELPQDDFPIPENIVFANIDTETGKLVSKDSRKVARQAFIEGTEPDGVQFLTQEEEEDGDKEEGNETKEKQKQATPILPEALEDPSLDEDIFIKEDLSR